MFEKKIICENCRTVGYPGRKVKGSIVIEVLLWLCFLIPGLLYSLWRHASAYKVCKACGSEELVPVDSPKGRKLIESEK